MVVGADLVEVRPLRWRPCRSPPAGMIRVSALDPVSSAIMESVPPVTPGSCRASSSTRRKNAERSAGAMARPWRSSSAITIPCGSESQLHPTGVGETTHEERPGGEQERRERDLHEEESPAKPRPFLATADRTGLPDPLGHVEARRVASRDEAEEHDAEHRDDDGKAGDAPVGCEVEPDLIDIAGDRIAGRSAVVHWVRRTSLRAPPALRGGAIRPAGA